MKLISSVNESRYKTIDAFFMDEYKWEFLADKYRITINSEEWAGFETDFIGDDDYTSVIYGDVNGHSCLNILQDAFKYKEIERLLKYGNFILYTNEDKDFHILVKNDY